MKSRTQKIRHMILADDGRSGSNFLVNALNSHPEVLNYNDVVGDWNLLYRLAGKRRTFFPDAGSYLEWVYSSVPLFYTAQAYSFLANLKRRNLRKIKGWDRIRTIGIKEFLWNLRKKDCAGFPGTQKDMRIIFLNRENVLQKYVSLRYAMKSRKWKTTSPGAGTPKLAVDIDDMLKRISDMEEKKKDFERFRDEYAGPKLVIRYSGYFRDQASMDRFNRKILELLEVRDLPLKSKHRKILPKRFEDKIENYDEVRHALTSIGREKYLDDR